MPILRLSAATLAVAVLAGCVAAGSTGTAAIEQVAGKGVAKIRQADEAQLPPSATPRAKARQAVKHTSEASALARPKVSPLARATSTPAPQPAAAPATETVGSAPAISSAAKKLPAGSGEGRRIVYAKRQQQVWLVDARGTISRTYRVSGQLSQPDPGTYSVYSKSLQARSAVAPPATMQYMVRFARGKATGAPIGFHDIPRELNGRYEQTESQLGQPISAGCVRQKRSDAAALWAFAPVGTKVVVVR